MRAQFASLRVFASAAFQRGEEQASRQKASWVGAASAAALAGGTLATLCEADPKFEPITYKNLKDPMTIYARRAIKRETQEQNQVHRQQEKKEDQDANDNEETKSQDNASDHPKATLQATSQAVRRLSERGAPLEAASQTSEKRTAQATSPLDTTLAPSQAPQMTADEVLIEEKTRKAKQHSGGLKIFSGNGNMSLALEIAKNLGINLGRATVGRFADGEVNVVIHENVRGKDVYVIQPTCCPVNDNLMELLLMVSTLRRASARRITVVIPYYGYARQDRKMQVR